MIYKILTADQWAQLQAQGRFAGSPHDLEDGFIHFSTAAQLPGTLAKYYAGQAALVLAAVDPAPLGDALRWEPARGGDLFPHLYAPLQRASVVRSWTIDVAADGAVDLPSDLPA